MTRKRKLHTFIHLRFVCLNLQAKNKVSSELKALNLSQLPLESACVNTNFVEWITFRLYLNGEDDYFVYALSYHQTKVPKTCWPHLWADHSMPCTELRPAIPCFCYRIHFSNSFFIFDIIYLSNIDAVVLLVVVAMDVQDV